MRRRNRRFYQAVAVVVFCLASFFLGGAFGLAVALDGLTIWLFHI